MTVAAATPARSLRAFAKIMALSLMFPPLMYLPLDGTAQRPPERCSGAQLSALLTPAMKECRSVSLCSIAYARQIEIVPATFISTLCESRLPFQKRLQQHAAHKAQRGSPRPSSQAAK